MITCMNFFALLVCGFCLEGIVCGIILSSPVPIYIMIVATATLILIIISEVAKVKMLVNKRKGTINLLFAFWLILILGNIIIGLSVTVYFAEVKEHLINLSDNLQGFRIFSENMSIEEAQVLNATYYFGTCLFLGLYARAYYRMFWVDHAIYIYRYLRKKVKNLNESLCRKLPIIEPDQALLGVQCSLCLQQYSEDEQVTRLPCSHIFHRNCIKIWVMRSNSCPLCRKKAIFL